MVGCMMVTKEIMRVVGGWAGKKKKKIVLREPGVSIICLCLNSGHSMITAIVSNASQQAQKFLPCVSLV